MADIVAEGRGVPCVVLVGVEATQYVGPEVGVPQHLEENLRLISQQSLRSSLVLSRPPSSCISTFSPHTLDNRKGGFAGDMVSRSLHMRVSHQVSFFFFAHVTEEDLCKRALFLSLSYTLVC